MQARRQPLITGNKWLITIPVMLAALIAVLDASIVNVAIPNMQSSFGVGVDEIDWVITGYLISNVIIIPTTGWMSSTFGLKRYFAISQIVFVIASVLCGLSWNLPSLVFFRVLQGIGGGAILPVALTIMLEAFPPQELPMASALFGVGAVLGPAIGPTLGGWLTDALSWQWIFYVNVPIVAASVILSQLLIHENPEVLEKRRRAPIDFFGLLFVAVWLGTMQVVLQEGQRDGWLESSFIVWLSVISVVFFVAFLVTELRNPHPLINLRIFCNRNFAVGSVAGGMLGAALFGAVFILPLFASLLLNYTALQIGLVLLPAALVSLVLFPVVGRLGSFIDPRVLMFIGICLFTASLLGNGFINQQTTFGWLVFLQTLRGAALPFLFTAVGALALVSLKPQDRADASSLYNLTRTLGGSIGIAIIATGLVNRQRFHFERFGESVTQFDVATRQRLAQLTAGVGSHGGPTGLVNAKATAVLSLQLTQQAYISAFDDIALALAAIFFLTSLLIPMFKTERAHMQQGAPAPAME
ncbi:MAG: DHA2 family efflux MFS transporter permease subunit [Candidatus Eremiobacteraeota bacterium]|nr:DHA2 family efflux MFS transporter permease subunit [Candidatus Eremiobacteraeota bacterium]